MTFDPAKDFQPVSLIARLPNMLVVNPKIPAKTVGRIRRLSEGQSGQADLWLVRRRHLDHLASELFKIMTGTKMTHVPYRSSGEVMQNVTAGHIDLAFDNMTLAWPQAKAGNVRALARHEPARRSATAPEMPPVAETCKGFEATSWHGLFAPAGTPQPDRGQARGGREGDAGQSPRTSEEAQRYRRGSLADDAGAIHRLHRRPSARNGRTVVKAAGVKID